MLVPMRNNLFYDAQLFLRCDIEFHIKQKTPSRTMIFYRNIQSHLAECRSYIEPASNTPFWDTRFLHGLCYVGCHMLHHKLKNSIKFASFKTYSLIHQCFGVPIYATANNGDAEYLDTPSSWPEHTEIHVQTVTGSGVSMLGAWTS